MIAAYIAFISFFRKIRAGWKDPELRGLFWTVLTLLLIGTIFYRNVEGWGWIDSFYFTVITLTTVGYGDFSPETNLGKLFTVFYIIMGLGVLTSFIYKLATVALPKGRILNRMSFQSQDQEDIADLEDEK